jgi:hypothetical protein
MPVTAAGPRPAVSVLAGQHRFQQPRAGAGERGPHRLLQHAQRLARAQHARGQAGQLAYLGGGDLLEPRREPPLSPPAGGEAAPVTGLTAQIASLTWLTSSTRDANR